MPKQRWDDFPALETWLVGIAAGLSDAVALNATELFVKAGSEGIKSLCASLNGTVLYLPMLVTPELAVLFEAQQTENQRNSNEVTVEGYKRDMENDDWLETGEGFKFDVFGQLVDGGHRVQGIARSKRTIRTLVVFGVQTEAALVIDSGRSRTTGNTLKFHGASNYQELAGVIPRLIAIEQYDRWVSPSRYTKPTREEIMNYYRDHPELNDIIQEAGRRASGKTRIPRATTTSVAIALAIMYRVPAHLQVEVREFFDGLSTGVGLQEDTAVLTLRNTMMQGAPPQWRRAARTRERGGFTIDETLALIFTAWNRRHEAKVKNIKVSSPLNEENFPRPKSVRIVQAR